MEGDGDGVQVSVESSWNVLQGSLDSCMTVVFLDPHTHDPIISTSPRASEKLILVPPTEPVPCEITVKFQGRLCHVQSFYTLSTARICELYSHSKHERDADYICTVKGWIPLDDWCFSDKGSERVLEAADVTHKNGTQERDFMEGSIGESVMSSVDSSTVAMNFAVDVDLQKSVYSSSDDSWVDLKSNGSFTAENTCASLTAPELDNWHVPINEDELAHLDDQLALARSRSKVNDTGVQDDSTLNGGCCEGNTHIVQCNTHAQQDMFEAELELVDHSPWAAITVRLLSLQDKSLVEVEQMVFLAVMGPVPEPASPCQSSEKGANSLFAMFLPSMLQLARGASGSCKGLLKCEQSRQSCTSIDASVMQSPHNNQASPPSSMQREAQNMMDKFSAENSSQSCELAHGTRDKLPAGSEEIGVASLENAVTEEVSVEQGSRDLAAHVHNNAACVKNAVAGEVSVEQGSRDLAAHVHNNAACVKNAVAGEVSVEQDSGDLAIHVHNNAACCAASNAESMLNLEGEQGISQQRDRNGTESKRTVEIGEPHSQADSNVMPRCNFNKSAGDVMAKDLALTLEKVFSERFDRLESLCLRMESYLQRTFENLDQRITRLEAQHRKGSEETDSIGASLKQSGMSIDASVMQSQHNIQESPPSSMQHTELSDTPPRSGCKEGVSIASTQSDEIGCSKAQDVLKEVPNPIFVDVVDSDFVSAQSLVKEAPSESHESLRGPATIVGSTGIQDRKPRASLDEAWASALSAFAFSFTPVVEVEAENNVKEVVDEQPSGSSCAASISMPQECETPRKERKATPHLDVDFATKDADSEAANSEDGPIYEDCAHTHFDEQLPTAHALPEKLASLLRSPSSNMSTSVPKDAFDFLGLEETQSMSSKARTEVNHLLEEIDLASLQGFPSLSIDAQSPCPQFDVFASADSNSMVLGDPKDNTPALRGGLLSPGFDPTSLETLDAAFFKEETNISTQGNDFSQCQENMDFFHLREKNQEFLFNFARAAATSNAQGLSFRSFFASFDTSKASQTEENEEEIFCNTRASSTVDLLGNFMSREERKVLDMSEVRDPESANSTTSFTYCEAEEATSFPDVPEEGTSNYQDGRACSEDSLCFSQDFDTCQNDLCDDEWSCAPNIFYLNDPEFSDDEKNVAVGAGVEEKIEMSDISDTDSTEDLPFWPALHNNARIDQQQQPTTVVFPGFENL